jgi:hypothetical protein
MDLEATLANSRARLTRRILFYQVGGFALAVAVLWADELLDLPNVLFRAGGAPRWEEALFESVFVVFAGALTFRWTRAALVRIRYLEGFHRICSFCKRVCDDQRWIAIDEFVTERTAAVFSHGLCPECLREHYSECADEVTGEGAH